MKMSASLLAGALLLAADAATAHEPSKHSTEGRSPATDTASAEVAAVVDQFGAALKVGNTAVITRLLDERVLILESGGAERSRDEYLGHHAISDAAFLSSATITPKQRVTRVHGDTAWVGSESEIASGQGSDAKAVLSTETMVLRREAAQWKIVHIHWSSRPKKATAK